MERKIWRMHTGSHPGCQETPETIIENWFGWRDINLDDAEACFTQCIEYYSDDNRSQEDWEDHRCFNRHEYELTLDDVKCIITELMEEK